ncbi:MAG: glycine cleavage system protein H [Clostridia bacterium]|nr:glycine cleavage system protein H [Clostridia bacterium]
MNRDFYTYDNIRASVGEGAALLFLTDYGIEKYGKIGFINLCDEGDEISIDEPFGDCEAAKGVFDLISPVSGEVVRVNDEILNDINLLTGEAFLVEIRISEIAENLLNHDEYIKYTKAKAARFQPPRDRKI